MAEGPAEAVWPALSSESLENVSKMLFSEQGSSFCLDATAAVKQYRHFHASQADRLASLFTADWVRAQQPALLECRYSCYHFEILAVYTTGVGGQG
jgi:hypothetical protein